MMNMDETHSSTCGICHVRVLGAILAVLLGSAQQPDSGNEKFLVGMRILDAL
jgi:hypothetical protein